MMQKELKSKVSSIISFDIKIWQKKQNATRLWWSNDNNSTNIHQQNLSLIYMVTVYFEMGKIVKTGNCASVDNNRQPHSVWSHRRVTEPL